MAKSQSMSACQGWGGVEWEEGITKGHEETFWGNGCVHSLDCSDGFIYIHIYVYVYICQNVSNGTIKYMHFAVCQLHLNKNNCEPNVFSCSLLTHWNNSGHYGYIQ